MLSWTWAYQNILFCSALFIFLGYTFYLNFRTTFFFNQQGEFSCSVLPQTKYCNFIFKRTIQFNVYLWHTYQTGWIFFSLFVIGRHTYIFTPNHPIFISVPCCRLITFGNLPPLFAKIIQYFASVLLIFELIFPHLYLQRILSWKLYTWTSLELTGLTWMFHILYIRYLHT